MSVNIQFSCGGCQATAEGTSPIRRRFESFSGRPWGLGGYKVDTIESVTPDGWIAFDPYTQCCYCPTCWAEIDGGGETMTDPITTQGAA